MEHRALGWLKRRNRFDVFRLITSNRVNSRVYLLRENMGSGLEREADSVSFANLFSLVNDLLKIDFGSFFLELAKLNRSFREKYPVPREPWLGSDRKVQPAWFDGLPVSDLFPSSLEGQFQSAVRLYCNGSHLPSQEEEGHRRISDYEAYANKLFSLLEKSSNGELSPTVKEQLFALIEFSFVDDLWLSEKGDSYADAELFELWAAECEHVNKAFCHAINHRRFDSCYVDRALVFDQVVGIKDIPYGDFASVVNEREKADRSINPDPLEGSLRGRYSWGQSMIDSSFRGSGVGTAISGLIWLECLELCSIRAIRTQLCAEIDEMRRIFFDVFFCRSSDEQILCSIEKMISLGSKVLTGIENSELRIYNAEGRFSFSLKRLLSVAKKYLTICDFESDYCFPDLRDLCRNNNLSEESAVDTDFRFELLAVCDAWSNYCRKARIDTFPKYYSLVLSTVLHAGQLPRRCKYCGGFFFPEAPNQKYCKRVIRQSGIRCSDVDQRVASGEKRSFNSKLQSVKAKARRAKGKSPTAQKYYEDLAEYIQNETGPLYQSSELVSRATYDRWLNAVIGPKSGALSRLRAQEYPCPLIWNDEVIKGTEWVDSSKLIAQGVSLKDLIFDIGGSRFEINDVVFLSGDIILVRSSWLLRCVIRYNSQHHNEPLPIPGLSGDSLYSLADDGICADSEVPPTMLRER